MKQAIIGIFVLLTLSGGALGAPDQTNQKASAPLLTDSAGATRKSAISSVFRVICPQKPDMISVGTGFLHKSGNILTAGHVVKGCNQVTIALSNNTGVVSDVVAIDADHDLALLRPRQQIPGDPLKIASTNAVTTGSQVILWGYPAGYAGALPMLSAGYIGGYDSTPIPDGDKPIHQLVLNAAINHGNSGGPVILVETGEVIGIADSKATPLSPLSIAALTALQNQQSGFLYPATMADGSKRNFSEGQVVAMVLEELRQQVQLVIGHAIMAQDIRDFLKGQKIDP